MPETGYTVSPIFDEEVTDDLIERCRIDALESADNVGAVLSESPPRVTEMTFPKLGLVRCLRFEMTR
jgi:hypothetical protein